MPVPVLTFFNNKGGVGKTSLVYHLAWMFADMGHRVLACDLDPQANLTAAFLDEKRLESLWDECDAAAAPGSTVFECVKPLMRVGDLQSPALKQIRKPAQACAAVVGDLQSPALKSVIDPTLAFGGDLRLIPGDLALAAFEDTLSAEWPNAMGSNDLYRPFRILTAFSSIMQKGAAKMDASIILADVGPNLGAINRSALIATDYVIVPLGADLFSLRGLQNLGPTLSRWRQEWQKRRDNWAEPDFALPNGSMEPIGYIVQQHGVRLERPIKAYDRWVNRMPEAYARNLLNDGKGPYSETPAQDERHALATVKHYRSLVPMAQEARKPVFHLTTADGALGAHAAAAHAAGQDFKVLTEKIIERIELSDS